MSLDIFSPVMFVDECLLDEKRTNAFRRAIRNKVKRGALVLDAGTGSGILALFAAAAGAEKVFAVEVDQEAIELARRAFDANPEGKRIQLIQGDIKSLKLPKPVDVVIMELLDTGLIAEQQALAFNALRRHKVIGPNTQLIPEQVLCCLDLLEYDFSFYGFRMPIIVQGRNNGFEHRVKRTLSNTVTYRHVNFGRHIQTHVDEAVIARIVRSGVMNAVRLRMQTVLHETIVLWETSDMNMPVVIPVVPRKVTVGDDINVSIRYTMGGGYKKLSVEVSSHRGKA